VPYISQCEHRLAAVAFTTCHSTNCAGRGDGGLGGIADAVFLNTVGNDRQSPSVARTGAQRDQRLGVGEAWDRRCCP
jgi:hypothetical protein